MEVVHHKVTSVDEAIKVFDSLVNLEPVAIEHGSQPTPSPEDTEEYRNYLEELGGCIARAHIRMEKLPLQ